MRIKVLGTLGNLFWRNRLQTPDFTLGVSSHTLLFWAKKIQVRTVEREPKLSKASVAEKHAAKRGKVETKTRCRATEGEAVRHSYWSVI